MATQKRAPKMREDPLKRVRDARKGAEAHSRSVGRKSGTFELGTKSASSSNAERKRPIFGKTAGFKPIGGSTKGGKAKGGGGGQRRDRKGRFA